jgi:hypothetical protein
MILTFQAVPEAVPEAFRKPLELLTGEVRDLYSVRLLLWDLWINSPGEQNPNIRLILDTAPDFFVRMRSILYEHLIGGIARLTDPPAIGKNQNLTFNSLFPSQKPPAIATLQQEAEPIRIIRHKIVAHLDHAAGLNPGMLPNDQTFRKIRVCIGLMDEIIGLAWKQWTNGGTLGKPDSDSMEIMNCLQKAEAYDILEREGLVMPDFWNAPEDIRREYLAKRQ